VRQLQLSLLFVLGLAVGAWATAGQAPAPLPATEQPQTLRFPPEAGTYSVLAVEAIDGDTVRFFWLVHDVGRLAGINAPELHGDSAKAGQAAKVFLAGKLSAKPMVCRARGREKYGRALIDLIGDDGRSLSAIMAEAGHAKAWDGQGARP